MFYFYIVRCSDNSLYCGRTNNLQRRIIEHNQGKSKSARYTRTRRPVKLVYFEEYPTVGQALQREAQVKKWPKAKKEKLVWPLHIRYLHKLCIK
jgi:putative endonuclease